MPKRKSRNKINKKKLDLMKPISISQFGTDNDPCFGKLHDATNSVCQRCGDSEICMIVMAQGNHKLRESVESKNSFKDIQPEEFKPDMPLIYKYIKEKLIEKGSKILLSSASKKVSKRFNLEDTMKLREVRVMIRKIAKQAIDLKVVISKEKKYLKHI